MKSLFTIFVSLVLSTPSFALDDCEPHGLLKGLACVKCSLKEQTGTNPSDKWIALLATAAQFRAKEEGRSLKKDTELRKAVIEMIQAYGFCDEEPADPNIKPYKFESTKRTRKKDDIDGLWKYVEGHTSLKSIDATCGKSDYCPDTQEGVMKVYGFNTGDVISRQFTQISNFKSLFNVEHKKFKEMNAIERQEGFQQTLARIDFGGATFTENGGTPVKMFSDDENGKGLKECLSRVKELVTGKASGSAVYTITGKISQKTQDLSIGICQKMASDCDLDSADFCKFQTREQKELAEKIAKEKSSAEQKAKEEVQAPKKESKMPDFFKPATPGQGVK
jgi:hypothetical protein